MSRRHPDGHRRRDWRPPEPPPPIPDVVRPALGESARVLVCIGCRDLLQPGEALRVVPLDGRRPFFLHRPHVRTGCLAIAGPADRNAIRLEDPDAAAAWDASQGVSA